MLRQLQHMGIRTISGDLVCDESYFDDLYWGNGWMWDDASSWYFAPISALTVNDNCVEVFVHPGTRVGDPLIVDLEPQTHYVQVVNHGLTVAEDDTVQLRQFKVERKWKERENTIEVRGGMPIGAPEEKFVIDVLQPALYAGTLVKEMLPDFGMTLQGKVRKGVTPPNAKLLVEHQSEPLSVVIYHTNKISDNLSAENILKTIGAEVEGPPGTAKKGLRVIRSFLQGLGIDSTSYQLADGSGVSRYNQVSPALLVRLLTYMANHFPVQAEFLCSLPIAGVDGSLEERMQGTTAQGKVRAKTGTLNSVSSLSGYLVTADGEPLVFSIMMEHFMAPADQARLLQDRICQVLTAFSRKEEKTVQP